MLVGFLAGLSVCVTPSKTFCDVENSNPSRSCANQSFRSIVLFRDPRDVVISEYKMRTQVFHRDPWIAKLSLEEFVRFKFEVSHIATAAWCCREFPFAKRISESAQDTAGFVFRSSFALNVKLVRIPSNSKDLVRILSIEKLKLLPCSRQ